MAENGESPDATQAVQDIRKRVDALEREMRQMSRRLRRADRARAPAYDDGMVPVVYIPPAAFLRAMLTAAWHSLRHPFTSTDIHLSTGRVLPPRPEEPA
jgi:hypothetical protein